MRAVLTTVQISHDYFLCISHSYTDYNIFILFFIAERSHAWFNPIPQESNKFEHHYLWRRKRKWAFQRRLANCHDEYFYFALCRPIRYSTAIVLHKLHLQSLNECTVCSYKFMIWWWWFDNQVHIIGIVYCIPIFQPRSKYSVVSDPRFDFYISKTLIMNVTLFIHSCRFETSRIRVFIRRCWPQTSKHESMEICYSVWIGCCCWTLPSRAEFIISTCSRAIIWSWTTK